MPHSRVPGRHKPLISCLVFALFLVPVAVTAQTVTPVSLTTTTTVVRSTTPAPPPEDAPADPAAAAPGEPRPAASYDWFGGNRPWGAWTKMTGDWARGRASLEAHGVSLNAWTVSDASRVTRGAAHATHAVPFRSLFDVDASFDLEKLLGVTGGTVHAQYFGNLGANGAAELGVFQAYSNIDADRFHRLGEFWYEQWLPGRRVRLKIGRVDANTEFDHVDNGAEFINASMGYSPTIFTLPTYPLPLWSANVFVYPTSRLYLGAGAYRRPTGGDGDLDRDDVGTTTATAFLIAEAGVTWSLGRSGLDGRLGVGAWYDDRSIPAFDGQTRGIGGSPFLVFDQTLWQKAGAANDTAPLSKVGVFFQFGSAPAHHAVATLHLGTGLQWTGPFASRRQDVFGFGATVVSFSPVVGPDIQGREWSVGPFYRIQATPWLSVKPDLQVVRNAGGRAPGRQSVVATLRFRLDM
jgi:porin